MSTDEYRAVLDQALRLTAEEQLQLIEDIIKVVRHQIIANPVKRCTMPALQSSMVMDIV